MFTINLSYLRGNVSISTTTTNSNSNTPFGRFVEKKIGELTNDLQQWAQLAKDAETCYQAGDTEGGDRLMRAFEKGRLTAPANKTTKKTAKKVARKDVKNDRPSISELKDELEKTGGLSASPASSAPVAPPSDDTAGVKVTGGENDPATKAPQPGTPGHKSDPNEGQDPVDSAPSEKKVVVVKKKKARAFK